MDASNDMTALIMERANLAKIVLPGAMSFIAGIVLVIALICLIVRAIAKKKLKGTLITLAVSLVVLLVGSYLSFAVSLPEVMTVFGEIQQEQNLANFSGPSDAIVFSATDKDGNEVDSSIFAGSKLTLVNRWEPWCGPCKAEMPAIEELYQKYKDQGFSVIGVYSDEAGLQEALDETGVTYPIILESGDFAYLEISGSVPASVFVDSDGSILTVPEEYRTSALLGEQVVSEDYDSKVIVGGRSAEMFEAMITALLG